MMKALSNKLAAVIKQLEIEIEKRNEQAEVATSWTSDYAYQFEIETSVLVDGLEQLETLNEFVNTKTN